MPDLLYYIIGERDARIEARSNKGRKREVKAVCYCMV
jgi:hypothetical protein